MGQIEVFFFYTIIFFCLTQLPWIMTMKVIIVNFLILNMGSGIVEFIVKIVSLTSKIAINGSRGLKRKFQW